MKVEPDRDPAHTEAPDQDFRHELLGRQAGERRIEGQHHRAVEPGRGQQPQFLPLIGQPEQCLVRPEIAARMRLQRQDRGRLARRGGARHGKIDDGAVAAMHAVEIADRDHGAAQLFDFGPIVTDHHKWLLANGLRHRELRLHFAAGRTVSTRRRRKSSGQALRARAIRAPYDFGRAGTDTIASPSSTSMLSTSASQCSRTLRPSGTSSITSTMTDTTSPILTGAWKFSVCDR